MIVCLCHRVSDRDIQREVGSGTCCFEQLQDDTRVASSCGSCLDCAREVFDAALQTRGGCHVAAAAGGALAFGA
ncbi:MAG: (2Fe-2S)-binding protein [Rhodoferax sp.]|jgi:bacterioferritin-associated ferredoxin|nr:(2Fe-2S)-binding protein [Rhodoferax sp.]MCL4739812.1 (2Fe-2S)-binding protein [Burkholderiaceae bacterium]MCP5289677.1 (2Fe-2S)-binding protein [Burkholderiaceae bacterium]HMQ73508.1 (2Fe-2S)-binding protein [Rubrivivax sp.]